MAVTEPVTQVLLVQVVGPSEEIVDDLRGSEGAPVWVLAQLVTSSSGGILVIAQQVHVRPEVTTDA